MPWIVSAPASRIHPSIRSGTGAVNVRLRAIRAGQSIVGAPTSPRPASPRERLTASAAASRTFLGSQPRWEQVPPKGRRSTTATLKPSCAQRGATFWAAVPLPITMTSYSGIAASSDRSGDGMPADAVPRPFGRA